MRRLLLPAIAALANAGSRGANGVALCGPDHIAIADSAADSVVILDPRRAEVVDIVPLPYGIFAHGVACLRQPTDHEPGVIIVTAQHGGHVFAAAYDTNRQHRLTTYAAWFASFRPNTTLVEGTYAVDAEPWRNMTHGPKGLALHDGIIYLPFQSRHTIISVDAADIVEIVSAKFRERRHLALAENALVWVNATSARIFGHPRKPYALAFGPWMGVEALYVLGGDGVVVLNITLNITLVPHAPVLATYVTENMRYARALAVLGEKVYLLVTKGHSSWVEAHAFSAPPYTVGVVGRGHGAGDGCGTVPSFSRPHSIIAAAAPPPSRRRRLAQHAHSKDALWVADMDNRAARSISIDGNRGCTSTIPYRSLLRRFHERPAAATPNCSQQLVPTAAAAKAACGDRRLCSAAELRPTDGIAWAAGDCASCFSHIETCDATKERWGADYFPLLTSSRKSTWLECRSARDSPRPQARACCCGPE